MSHKTLYYFTIVLYRFVVISEISLVIGLDFPVIRKSGFENVIAI